jgi:hypothetical protein
VQFPRRGSVSKTYSTLPERQAVPTVATADVTPEKYRTFQAAGGADRATADDRARQAGFRRAGGPVVGGQSDRYKNIPVEAFWPSKLKKLAASSQAVDAQKQRWRLRWQAYKQRRLQQQGALEILIPTSPATRKMNCEKSGCDFWEAVHLTSRLCPKRGIKHSAQRKIASAASYTVLNECLGCRK